MIPFATLCGCWLVVQRSASNERRGLGYALPKGRVLEHTRGCPIATCKADARQEAGVLNKLDCLTRRVAVECLGTHDRVTGAKARKVMEYDAVWAHGMSDGERICADLNHAEPKTWDIHWVNIIGIKEQRWRHDSQLRIACDALRYAYAIRKDYLHMLRAGTPKGARASGDRGWQGELPSEYTEAGHTVL